MSEKTSRLGVDYFGVVAYKNNCSNGSSNYIYNTFSGIQWQCIEYVRRWYILQFKVNIPSVEKAIDLWDVSYVTDIPTNAQHIFDSVPNGSNREPNVGDVLVFRQNNCYPYGHVAIITRITSDYIYIAEQNNDDTKWNKPYSRKIERRLDTIVDPSVLGWKTLLN